MIKFIISLFLIVTISSAAEMGKSGGSCILSQDGAINVKWEAFKTSHKIGVNGTFDSVKYNSVAPEGKNFREILVGSSVEIDTSSVNSKNEDMDKTLVKYFFKQLRTDKITAKIVDIKSNKRVRGKPKTGLLSVAIKVNGVTKYILMQYIFDKGLFTANGSIDLVEFGAKQAVKTLDDVCFDHHKGKTWSDVNIGFTTNIKFALCEN